MDNKGIIQIAFLPILLFILIALIIAGVLFTFFPSLVLAAVLGVLGAFLIFHSVPKLDSKIYQTIMIVGVIMILGSLFVGVAQPFSVFGDEYRYTSGSFYQGTLVQNTWIWMVGHGGDITSKSYFANDNLNVNIRVQSAKDSGTGATIYGGSALYCNPTNYQNVIFPVCKEAIPTGLPFPQPAYKPAVTSWGFNLFIDGINNGVYGNFSPSTKANYNGGGFMNMVTKEFILGNSAECDNALCTAQMIKVYNVDQTFYSLININKNFEELGYDKTKSSHNIELTAFPLDGDLKYGFKVYSNNFYVEPIECSDQSNFVTKMFTASAGDVVSTNPIIGEIGIPQEAIFCHSLPVLKQVGGVVLEQDYEPYEVLKTGEKIVIPIGQNWIFFYKDVPTNEGYYFCANNEGIYNSVTNKCEIVPAIEYTCVSGVFNPITKTCLSQAVVEKICSAGVYNTQTDRCEYIPPISILCSEGKYNSATQKCEVYPNVENICSSGEFNPITQQCEVYPLFTNVCLQGTFNGSLCVFNPDTVNVCLQGIFDNTTQTCVYTPAVENVCPKGVYNASTNTCVFSPNTSAYCSIGTYNSILDKCVYTPPIANVCEKGVFDSTTNTCLYSPIVNILCNKGVFDSATNTCVYTPSINNVCEKGEFNSSSGYCVYTPELEVVCSNGVYDVEKDVCVLNASPIQGETGVMKLIIIVVVVGSVLTIILLFSRRVMRKKKKRR